MCTQSVSNYENKQTKKHSFADFAPVSYSRGVLLLRTDQFDCQYKWGMITENKSSFTVCTAWGLLFGDNLRIKRIDRTGSVKCDKLYCSAVTVPQTIQMLKLKEQWGAGDLFDCCFAVEKTPRTGSSCTETRFNSGQPLPPCGYRDFIKWAQICICVNSYSINKSSLCFKTPKCWQNIRFVSKYKWTCQMFSTLFYYWQECLCACVIKGPMCST